MRALPTEFIIFLGHNIQFPNQSFITPWGKTLLLLLNKVIKCPGLIRLRNPPWHRINIPKRIRQTRNKFASGRHQLRNLSGVNFRGEQQRNTTPGYQSQLLLEST